MAAGIRAVLEVADLIDVVIEVRDARVPRATAVAGLHPRLKRKPTIVLLNRADLADASATRGWVESLKSEGLDAFATTATHAGTLRAARAALLARPRKRAVLRAAVVGAPNTGKSSVINALGRRKRTVVADRAGVTRHAGWSKLEAGVELLDTPGLLPPRVESAQAAWQLSLCGSLPETAFDVEEAVDEFARWLARNRPRFAARADLDAFAQAHGMRRRGGELDRRNAARRFVADFRAGDLFRLTFESPGSGRDSSRPD
jgi:ribosome biogenesis GTPase A